MKKTRVSAPVIPSEAPPARPHSRVVGPVDYRLVDPAYYDMLSKYDLVGIGVMLSPNTEGQVRAAPSDKPVVRTKPWMRAD